MSALRTRLRASVSEELEQVFLSFEVINEIAPFNAWAARFQAGYCVEDRNPGKLMVSQEVDQFQGLETVEPPVKLGFESRVVCRVLLQARPDFFKTIELEELPQLGGDAAGPGENLRGAAVEVVDDHGQPVTEDLVTFRMVDS